VLANVMAERDESPLARRSPIPYFRSDEGP
jgi:hypothetical protein